MDPFIAEIIMFGGNFAPRGWLKCEGQLLSINAYQTLFSLLGTTYGGDGRVTFAVPDMRGRVPVSPGTGPGLSSYYQGPGGGHESVFLTTTNMPSHTHIAAGTVKAAFVPPTGGATLSNPNAASFSGNGTSLYSNGAMNVNMAANNVDVTVGNTGGNAPFSVIQPWCSVLFIIATEGIYPSRS